MASILEVQTDSLLLKKTHSYGCLGDVTMDGCASIHGDLTTGDSKKSLKMKMTFYDMFVCNQIINIMIYLHTIWTTLSNYFYTTLTPVS